MKSLLIILFTVFILTNTHAEKRWVLKYKPPESPGFSELNCIDTMNCVAIVNTVDHNTIYKSSDQGSSWHKFSSFNRSEPKFDSIRTTYQCKAFDSLNVYLLFIEGAVMEKSSDGGKTFKRVYFEELYKLKSVERLYDLTMFTENIGASITRTTLLYTNDNWDTYKAIPRPDSIFAGNPIFFVDSNNIAVLKYIADTDEFMNYNIPNDEWSQYNIGEKIPKGENNKSMIHLQFVNDSLIYACGHQLTGVNNFSKYLIWKSTDRGKTWIKLMDQFIKPGFGIRRIAFRNELHGIAVGNWGVLFETTDGGESWFKLPTRDEFEKSIAAEISWAGSQVIYATDIAGIFRLETVTDVEELSSDEKFRVFQSGHNLEVAINDESHATYSFSLYNSSGQTLMRKSIKSSFGFVFEPVELIDLTNGVYYYTISKNNCVEFNGKLVVVE